MFDIGEINLENFRSYRGKHTIALPEKAGLYLITGRNDEEPRLGSNGIGKSTLLDSIYWCLYGHTTRGLKAGDVITWGEKQCSVTVELWLNDVPLKVRRTQSPNSLMTSNGIMPWITVSQEELEKCIGLGPQAFTYAVLLPQFGDSFFDLAPAAKLTLFSQIMGLDYWLEKSQEAQTLVDEITATKSAKEQAVAKCQGQIEIMVSDIESYGKQKRDFATTQAAIVAKAKKELAEAIDASRKDGAAMQFTDDALKNIENKLAKEGKAAKICPACGQKVANKTLEGLLKNKADFERQAVQLQRQFDAKTSEELHLKERVEIEAARLNPYEGQIKQKQASIAAHKTRLADLRKDIEALDEDYIAVSFWVAGFKRVRLFIVEQTLRLLEIEVNNNMSSLGLTDWHIEFDVERENKAGGVTKGFVVLVYAPGHTEPVRFEAWSGGEIQRLCLAGSLGLSNLIMERAGLRGQIEFFDEPSQHLSEEGLLDVAETLHQRALSGNKRIFLVDHTIIDFGNFTRRLTLVKDADGSRLTG